MNLLVFVLCFVNAALIDDRMNSAKIWIFRSNSSAQMALAYSNLHSNENTSHIVRDVGDFYPRIVSYEYDSVVLDLEIFLGYNPFTLRTHFDVNTIRWIDNDTLRIDYTIDIRTAYNLSSGEYLIDEQGFRYTEFIVFEPNTSIILVGYTIQDPAAIQVFALTYSITPNDYICNSLIIPACNGTAEFGYLPFLSDTGFANAQDCITFLNNLAPTVCPYVERSNTKDCRQLHAMSAFLGPQIHCAHVKPISAVCSDSCLPACSNCDINAECVGTYPTLFTPVYECRCKNGYTGNGTSCTPLACNYGNCPALHGSYECSTGLCKCTDTFVSNPTSDTNICTCDGQIIYNNSKPICVPIGRCISEQWECNLQDYNQVKCLSVGKNTHTLFHACLCNYGFQGGWEYPCVCPSNKRILWSNTHNGEVCLASDECTINWHCAWPQACHIVPGEQVGKCL